MAVILWAMGLSLLIQGCLSSIGNTDRGCLKWVHKGNNVCCEECYPGNRLVRNCGPSPKDLCTPCAQVLVKECTATTDTKCGCQDKLICGDALCSFCIKNCGKGEEPTEQRSCRPCPNGTFNDQSNQKCKPWSTKCPNPDQVIVARADAFNDIRCNASVSAITIPKQHDDPETLIAIECSFHEAQQEQGSSSESLASKDSSGPLVA
ncbi:hypothetical protein PAMP_012359 [Pampus punctatissimus]